jgi:hypothetical protein
VVRDWASGDHAKRSVLLVTSYLHKYPEIDPLHPTVSIDFDGVLAENTWPSPHLGRQIPEGVQMLLHYAEQQVEIVILTARPPSHWPDIWKWLTAKGLQGIVYDVSNIKQPACIYIDDRAWRFPFE